MHTPPNDPKKREALPETVRKLAEVPTIPIGSMGEDYEFFKQIEADLKAAEDDPELYNALMFVRTRLKEAMEVRAREAGKADDWAEAMKEHDTMLLLRPLFRAQNDAQEYINTYCGLSAEQKAALDYWGKKTGIHLPRPEVERGLLLSRQPAVGDRKSTRLNSSHQIISYAVFSLKKTLNL